jgi:hypothetical protein
MKKAYILDIYDMISDSQNGKRKGDITKNEMALLQTIKGSLPFEEKQATATDATKASQRLG